MHVFPFSPRPGTAAARWGERFVAPDTAKTRVRRLIALEVDPDDGFSIRYRRRLVGRTVRVIVEQPDRLEPTRMTGRCDHYALIDLETDRPRGDLVHAEIVEATANRTRGRIVPAATPLPVASPRQP